MTETTTDDLMERTERYLRQLPPHQRDRLGPRIIEELWLECKRLRVRVRVEVAEQEELW